MNTLVASLIALVICVFLFIFLCFKGMSPIIVGILCAAIMALVSIDGFVATFFDTLANSMGSSFVNLFVLYASASVMGGIFSETKMAAAIAKIVMKKVRRDWVPVLIMCMVALIGICGVPASEFVNAAYAIPLLIAVNLPAYLGLVAQLGTNLAIAWGLPGLPSPTCAIPNSIFGIDSLYAAPLAGYCMTAAALLFAFIYLRVLTKKAIKKQESFDRNAKLLMPVRTLEEIGEEKTPHIVVAIIPIVIIMGGVLLLGNVVGLASTPAVVFSQVAADIYMVIVGWKSLKGKKLATGIVESITRILPLLVAVGAVTTFGTIASNTEVYNAIIGSVFSWNIAPYILVIVAVSVYAAITSDAIAALMIVQGTGLGEMMLAMPGANAGIMAVLARAAAAGFDTLPWSPNVIMPLSVYGLNLKNGYKYSFVCTVVEPFIMVAVGLIIGYLVY